RGFAGKDANALASTRTAFSKLNLNRYPLTDYPQPDATGHIDLSNKATAAQVDQANQDRQNLCQDIFDLLRFVTTGARPGAPLPAYGGADYNALRWLAQLSVNIVDMRDTDNICTAFLWDPAQNSPSPY